MWVPASHLLDIVLSGIVSLPHTNSYVEVLTSLLPQNVTLFGNKLS